MSLTVSLPACLSPEAGVFQVLFSVSQQDLLSRLMLFGSAATVDAVCHLNSWGRCSIPIHALQVGGDTHLYRHATDPLYIHRRLLQDLLLEMDDLYCFFSS